MWAVHALLQDPHYTGSDDLGTVQSKVSVVPLYPSLVLRFAVTLIVVHSVCNTHPLVSLPVVPLQAVSLEGYRAVPVSWRGVEAFSASSFYNLCLPQRPALL